MKLKENGIGSLNGLNCLNCRLFWCMSTHMKYTTLKQENKLVLKKLKVAHMEIIQGKMIFEEFKMQHEVNSFRIDYRNYATVNYSAVLKE